MLVESPAYGGGAGYLSESAIQLALRAGKVAIPCLLRMAHGNPGEQETAIPMLLEINSTRADISPSESREIRDVVINALKDPAPAVRRAYVGAVGRLGKPDLIPALEDIADFDSYSEPPNTDHFPVREAAQEAIQAIQQRAKAQ